MVDTVEQVSHEVAVGFTIELHGPFRVATGYARDGLDAVADPDEPLPATALKGLARHQSSHVLGLPSDLVAATFGSASRPSPWRWSDAQFDELVSSRRAHTAIEPGSGRPADGSLRIVEELWTAPETCGAFRIVNEVRLDPAEAADQLAVLIASTCSIHGLGSDRRRGLGWCTITLDHAESIPGELDLSSDWASVVAQRCVDIAGRARSATEGTDATEAVSSS